MKIIYFFGQLLFIPHVLLFLGSKNKHIIIQDIYTQEKAQRFGRLLLYDLSFKLLTNPYFRTLFYFRASGFFSKVLRVFYPKHPSLHIEVKTKIGGGLHLAHPYATIINAEELGEHVYINHLVTIGEVAGNKPTIGNHVQIHANATIIGGVTIGDYAIIGAGAVVVKDVPAHAIAVGNPARIITKAKR